MQTILNKGVFTLGMVGSAYTDSKRNFLWNKLQLNSANSIIKFILENAKNSKLVIPPIEVDEIGEPIHCNFEEITGDLVYVSGGCAFGGPDIWGEIAANKLKIPTKIFLPHIQQWKDLDGKKGYMTRNKEIADFILPPKQGVLYDIEPIVDSDATCTKIINGNILYRSSGGTWTARYAGEHGKRVLVIPV